MYNGEGQKSVCIVIHCIALSLSLALGSASMRCSGVGTLVQLASDADLLTGT